MLSTVIFLFIAFYVSESENETCNSDCPELHLSYLKDFDPSEDVSDECRDDKCLILQTGLISEGFPWNGFCVRGKVFYAFWECGLDESLKGRKIKFKCLVNTDCSQSMYCHPGALDDHCLCETGGLDYCKGINSTETTTTTTTEASTFSVVSTADSDATTGTTESSAFVTEETTTEITERTTIGKPFECDRGPCFEGECFFRDHCYFFYDPDFFQSADSGSDENSEPNGNAIAFSARKRNSWLDLYEDLTSDVCSDSNPTALAVAVESPEENVFVKNLILDRSDSAETKDSRILTSGIKRQKPPGEWQGWNSVLNETVLGLETSHAAAFPEYIALRVNSGTVKWYYQSPVSREPGNRISVLCERDAKNWMDSPDFTEECKALESQEICSGKEKKFCCGADENGTLWLGCSGSWSRKSCRTAAGETEKHIDSRWWYCNEDGFFETEFPHSNGCICKKCDARYQGISFKTCHGTEAIGGCRNGRRGHSNWFCGSDGVFRDLPDFHACCGAEESPCRGVDPFANVWVSCPGNVARKRTRCPEGSFFESAEATWRCGGNGSFVRDAPDYSDCDCPDGSCFGTDEYLVPWKACRGETAVRECPSGFGGTATWKCGSDGRFENPRPDYSGCLLTWVDDVQKETCSINGF